MPEPLKSSQVPKPSSTRDRITILHLLLLMAGVGIGLTISRPIWSAPYQGGPEDPIVQVPVVVRVIVAVLGGLSFMGVPLLLTRLTKRRTPWGPGKVAWFSQGVATWLLWPPIVLFQMQESRQGMPWSSVCWLWGTPLMGLYTTAAILLGGWFGRRGRRRLRRSGKEQFGLLLSCLWACTGLYLLSLLYWIDLFKRR